MRRIHARASVLCLNSIVLLCLLAPQAVQATQGRSNPKPEDIFDKLVNSAAAAIYTIAWPTATYKRCELVEIRPANSGFDIVVKLSGLSGWDKSDLWLFLDFAFRDGDLKNMWVVKHNGNWPPFATADATYRGGKALWKEYVQPQGEAGAVCLINPTQSSVVFQYRWGIGSWQEVTLQPGVSYMFWWTYTEASGRNSPPFEIRYDDSFEDGYTEQRYTLNRNVAKIPVTCQAAKQYSFSIVGPKVFLRSVN
jgi:hypothetical protein